MGGAFFVVDYPLPNLIKEFDQMTSTAANCNYGPMIADSCRLSLAYAERLLKDIPAERFARLATVGDEVVQSNHPAFIYGHLSLYPCRIVAELGHDASSIKPTEAYVKSFDHNAKCVDDSEGSIYPAMDEITDRFFAAHRLALDVLMTADDSLFKQMNPNEAMRGKFATIGSMHGFYVGGHIMIHMGQLSAWRRMIGLPPG
jgi:hypothetical protein